VDLLCLCHAEDIGGACTTYTATGPGGAAPGINTACKPKAYPITLRRIPLGVFNVFSWNLYLFADRYLIEGRFDRVLLRPVSSVFQVLFESFRLESVQETATGLFAIVWASRRMGLAFGPLDIVLFVAWAICGAVIYLAIFLGLTATSFWIEDRIGISPPVFNLMQFGRYPLTISTPGCASRCRS
jgi:ABC-type uncharacterized transport system permease subunit